MTTPHARIEAYIQDALRTGKDMDIEDIAQGVSTLPQTRQARRAVIAWLLFAHPWVHSQIKADYPAVLAEEPCVVLYTTAPESYDGFGTETLGYVGTLDDTPLRKIETPMIHVEWQTQRNGSGMYPTYTETAWTHLRQMPWFTEQKDEPMRRVKSATRVTIDLSETMYALLETLEVVYDAGSKAEIVRLGLRTLDALRGLPPEIRAAVTLHTLRAKFHGE